MKRIFIILVAILAMAAFVSPVLASDYGRDGPSDFIQSIQIDTNDSLVATGLAVGAAAGNTTFVGNILAVVGFDTGDERGIIILSPNYTNKGSSLKYGAYIVKGHNLYLQIDKGAFAYSMARHVSNLVV